MKTDLIVMNYDNNDIYIKYSKEVRCIFLAIISVRGMDVNIP